MSDVTNPYARLLWWSVENFMSVEKAKVDYDASNIINFKGYNDSGKSAMLMALRVLLTNYKPTKQVSFIQDGKEYFRILAGFEDGVLILRDKYINGQSLYEMYKDNKLVYTTKQDNGVLAKVTEVPEPIANYLGLLVDEDTCINARSCFEKQIGVQTTGSENYKLFNNVLKSEEIARASGMLNTDKNSLLRDINAVDTEITADKAILGESKNLTKEIIDYLKEHDSVLDGEEVSKTTLENLNVIKTCIADIRIAPQVNEINTDRLSTIFDIDTVREELKTVKIAPELKEVPTNQLVELGKIKNLKTDLDTIKTIPEVNEIDAERCKALIRLSGSLQAISDIDATIKANDAEVVTLNAELKALNKELESQGVKMVICPRCGEMFDPNAGHKD